MSRAFRSQISSQSLLKPLKFIEILFKPSRIGESATESEVQFRSSCPTSLRPWLETQTARLPSWNRCCWTLRHAWRATIAATAAGGASGLWSLMRTRLCFGKQVRNAKVRPERHLKHRFYEKKGSEVFNLARCHVLKSRPRRTSLRWQNGRWIMLPLGISTYFLSPCKLQIYIL